MTTDTAGRRFIALTLRFHDVAFSDTPSVEHDTLTELFRDHPDFAVDVLRDYLGANMPPGLLTQVRDSAFNDRISRDSKADTVITIGPTQGPSHGVIVEIQREISQEKREAWLRYATALWQQLGTNVTVLVICPDPKTAEWAAKPIQEHVGDLTVSLTPRVLGPDLIPVMRDPAEVAAAPEMAALSVMAHGHDRTVTAAFLTGLESLSREHAELYTSYAHRIAPDATRRLMEALMPNSSAWIADTPLGIKIKEQARAEGLMKGRVEGRAEGEARGEARVLLGILRRRGVRVSDEIRERITSCADLDQLEEWAWRANSVSSADELFTP